MEVKLAYIRLNSQTPCPPRGGVLVNFFGQYMDELLFFTLP
jgi:hypothetical protein